MFTQFGIDEEGIEIEWNFQLFEKFRLELLKL